MRILLLVLAVTAVALLAFPSSPVSPVAPASAFASEVTQIVPVQNSPYCSVYCTGNPGSQYCTSSQGGRNGCHHTQNGNCIFVLCNDDPPCPGGPCIDPSGPPVE